MILLAGLLLVGCGQEASAPLPAFANVESLLAELPEEDMRAETFASDLCVIRPDTPHTGAEVNAEAAGLFSLNDCSVIEQKNAFRRMNPASITKILTALVAIRESDLSEKVTVGDEVVITEPGASLCHIQPGDTLTMEQLLYGLMLPSGNDAGAAIAVHMDGSIEAFADRMNAEARALGATGSHFVNPHGLTDEDHYTTVYDLYLIFQEAMKEPAFRQLIGTVSYTADYTDAEGQPKSQTWKNSNQYLTGNQAAPQGVTVLGGKTGTTNAAGYCLIMGSQDEAGNEYVSVVMKADSRPNLYDNMTKLIEKIVN